MTDLFTRQQLQIITALMACRLNNDVAAISVQDAKDIEATASRALRDLQAQRAFGLAADIEQASFVTLGYDDMDSRATRDLSPESKQVVVTALRDYAERQRPFPRPKE